MPRVLGFILIVLVAASGSALAGQTKLGELAVADAWARATIGQQKSGVAYLTVTNEGAVPDRLLAVATPVAKMAHLHTHLSEDGVMKMRPVEAIEIPAGGTVTLEPGGLHIMLMGVAEPLKEGEMIPMTLTFENAGVAEIEVMVQEATAMRHGQAGHEDCCRGAGKHDHSAHGHGAHKHGEMVELSAGPDAPTLDVEISEDSVGGWNLRIVTTNFTFTPEKVNRSGKAREGHAHLYVNGEKAARIYGPWFHIASLPQGTNEVTVILNTNDHRHIGVEGIQLSKTLEVQVP